MKWKRRRRREGEGAGFHCNTPGGNIEGDTSWNMGYVNSNQTLSVSNDGKAWSRVPTVCVCVCVCVCVVLLNRVRHGQRRRESVCCSARGVLLALGEH